MSGVRVSNQEHTNLVDEVNSTLSYLGKALPGSATSSPVWQIKKITITGTVTAIKLANGSSGFNQVWDDRASLTYT